MSQIIPIYIPTYISDQNYNPSRVLPRLFYYNGLVDCETWYLESGSLTTSGIVKTQEQFPYFDNYNVVSGSFPTAGSDSLLFNNEAAVYGEIPSSSLFTQYWDNYVALLYNPKTRLLTAKAIIPLADYVKMELNDVVNFRGNYYHLRAINNYSLKTGDCELQLLGPIIADTFYIPPPPPPAPPTTASVNWTNITDNDVTSSFRIYDNGSLKVSSSITQGGTLLVSQSRTVNAELDVTPFPVGGAMTMSLNINGGATVAVSASTNTTLTASFVTTGGVDYYITASVNYIPPVNPQVSWSFTEGNNTTASFRVYDSGSLITTLTSSASGNRLVSGSNIVTVELNPVTGSWILGTTMSINVNGGDTTIAVSGSTDTTISASFTASFNNNYYITASSNYNLTYVSGAKIIFDFGNSASYPGSGSNVTNLGSGGSTFDGKLVNSPTYLTSSGGVMEFVSASSQYLEFSSSLSASFTTFAILLNNASTSSWGTGAKTYNGFPNIRGNNGFIMTNEVAGNTQVIPILWAGSTANVPAQSLNPANIGIFHSYAYTSNGSNEHKMYLDTGSPSTSTTTYTRGDSAVISSYIGRDVPNNGYLNGKVMCYLQYDRVLTADEIKQNFEIFERRFK